MNEKPIIFNSEMIRAVLDGRKSQTRRVIKDQPTSRPTYNGNGDWIWNGKHHPCPYGYQGTGLWVRETFAIESNEYMNYVYKKPSNPLGPVRELLDDDDYNYFQCARYKASEPHTLLSEDGIMRWSPSIHMPRWASRITLEITNIRVEKIKQISTNDIRAEGVNCPTHDFESGFCVSACLDLFNTWADLWQSINKKRGYGWEVNPWVWVVEFKKVDNE